MSLRAHHHTVIGDPHREQGQQHGGHTICIRTQETRGSPRKERRAQSTTKRCDPPTRRQVHHEDPINKPANVHQPKTEHMPGGSRVRNKGEQSGISSSTKKVLTSDLETAQEPRDYWRSVPDRSSLHNNFEQMAVIGGRHREQGQHDDHTPYARAQRNPLRRSNAQSTTKQSAPPKTRQVQHEDRRKNTADACKPRTDVCQARTVHMPDGSQIRTKCEQSVISPRQQGGISTKTVLTSDSEAAKDPRYYLRSMPDGYSLSTNFEETTVKDGISRRTIVNREDKTGKYQKVGRKKYFVMKAEVVTDCWTKWDLDPSRCENSQGLYFGSDAEDEAETEYLKTAAEALEMNW